MGFRNVRWVGCLAALISVFAAGPGLSGQKTDRSSGSEEAERTALDYFSSGDYDKAVPVLTRAASEEPDNARLLSLLGAAYLYSSSRIDSAANLAHAQPTMEQAIEHGGEALFLVGKASDRLKEKFVVRAVMGELKIAKDSMTFTPTRGSGEGMGPVSRADIKECGPNKGYGKDSNTFHIKTTRAEFDFRPLHFSREEANLVCALAAKYLGARTGN